MRAHRRGSDFVVLKPTKDKHNRNRHLAWSTLYYICPYYVLIEIGQKRPLKVFANFHLFRLWILEKFNQSLEIVK